MLFQFNPIHLVVVATLAIHTPLHSSEKEDTEKAPKKKQNIQVQTLANKDIVELEYQNKSKILRRIFRDNDQAKRQLLSTSTYHLDKKNRPRICYIADPKGNIILVVRYGYNKTTGLLVVESIFKMADKALSKPSRHKPLQRIYYRYSKSGQLRRPFSINGSGSTPSQQRNGWLPSIKKTLKELGIPHTPSTSLSQKDIESVLPQTMK